MARREYMKKGVRGAGSAPSHLRRSLPAILISGIFVVSILATYALFSNAFGLASYTNILDGGQVVFLKPKLDKAEYDERMLTLAHISPESVTYDAALATSTASSTIYLAKKTAETSVSVQGKTWPTPAPYPNEGAILPFKRIVAYYGNFYSKQMGVLGEYDEETVLAKLRAAAAEWELADPNTPVVPAIEYIDVTAQAAAGKDGKYRARMADSQIDKSIEMAQKVHGIVVLDLQVGLSSVQEEVPLIDTYLARPDVHLALDPEFDMPGNTPPGRVIGTMDASTINWAIQHLSQIVRDNNLPPKILLIHRFTEDMVTNYQNIQPTPEVQVVIQMDGWGSPQRKVNTYTHVVAPEPVQFTGFKIFYKNDLKEDPPRLMTPAEVLKLTPSPIYIQYQ